MKRQPDNRQLHPNELGLARLPMRRLLALAAKLRTRRLRLAVVLEAGSFRFSICVVDVVVSRGIGLTSRLTTDRRIFSPPHLMLSPCDLL